MKHLKYQLIVVFAVSILVCSCKKEDQVYSCNPTINEWVRKNKSSFQEISREQIGLLPMGLQKSVFRSLTPEKQWQLWVEKFNIVRSQWDAPVQRVVDLALKTMDASWYSQPLTDDRLKFINAIEDELLTNLMDSIDYVVNFCLLSTENELLELRQPERIDYSWISFPPEISIADFSKEAPGGGSAPVLLDCKCEWDVSCLWSLSGCIKEGCNKTNTGCGFGFSKPCTGTCSRLMF
ncbi:MAG: bacteriocin fulvocin C-related protein [Bacteroidales bacterium]|nr:bacteriocin fulvocin C-related protein [Bacteroidales bacterium]